MNQPLASHGMPKSAVAEHLEILRRCFRRGGCITDAHRKARALIGICGIRLISAGASIPIRSRSVGSVASMRKLVAQLTSRHDPLGPTYDQRITDAAAVRVLLVAP